jgi:hypothetical protein
MGGGRIKEQKVLRNRKDAGSERVQEEVGRKRAMVEVEQR